MNGLRALLEHWTEIAIPLLQRLPQDSLEEEERQALQRGSLFRTGALRDEIHAIEHRLKIAISAELKELLEFTDGFLIPVLGTGPAEFLSTLKIDLYREREKATFDQWIKTIKKFGFDTGPSDDTDDENVLVPAIESLSKAIALSSQRGFEVLLMYPTSPQSWEYLKLSIHTSSQKYKSLATMLRAVMENSITSLQSQIDGLN